jgi:hypothetical protein
MAVLLWTLVNLAITIYALHLTAEHYGIGRGWVRLGVTSVLLLSPFSLGNLYTGQLSAFVLLGLVGSFVWHSSGIAPMLLAVKPNLGILAGMVWFIDKIRNYDWKPILRTLMWFSLISLILTMMAPGIWAGLLDNLLSARYMATVPKQITSIPHVLRRFGISPWLWSPWIIMGIWAIFRWPGLETTASASLIITPFARPHDNILLFPVILYYVQRRSWVAMSLSTLLLCSPLLRLFFPIGYWVDGMSAMAMFLILIVEKLVRRERIREARIEKDAEIIGVVVQSMREHRRR